MIGLDTSVLVRYLIQDDPVQSPHAGQLMERHCTADDPCLVNAIVLSESAENPAVQGLSLPTFTSVFVAIHPSKHPVFELHKPLPERFPTGVAVPSACEEPSDAGDRAPVVANGKGGRLQPAHSA